MPLYRIRTRFRGAKLYEIQAETEQAADDAWYELKDEGGLADVAIPLEEVEEHMTSIELVK